MKGAAKILPFPRGGARQRDAREFLPAALEIIDTPASPAGRATALTIIAAALSAMVWAWFGEVDIIASASGRIVPVGKSKTVQPLEAAVVRDIRVDDGSHVQAGDVLVELDPTGAEADRARLARDLLQARLDRARLEGLRRAWQAGTEPALLEPPADATAAQSDAAAAAMRAQYAEQIAKLASLDDQITAKRAEAAEATATLAKLQASLPLVAEQAELRRQLKEMQWGNKLAWLEIQQRLVEQQHEIGVVGPKRDQAEAARGALERQRQQAIAEYEKSVLTDLAKAEQQMSQSGQELIKAVQKAQLQTLRAPIAGTVQQLAVHTVGGVVTAAQPVLVIVPDEGGLVVEAMVENKDVGFVHPGQEAEIKIESFNFTRYGLIRGTVTGLSRDTVGEDRAQNSTPRGTDIRGGEDRSQQGSGSPAYIARIALEHAAISTENGVVDLAPGMAVTAEIKTGRRRVIDYLLSPLVRFRQEGFRER